VVEATKPCFAPVVHVAWAPGAPGAVAAPADPASSEQAAKAATIPILALVRASLPEASGAVERQLRSGHL
jgi:hypothetical protein